MAADPKKVRAARRFLQQRGIRSGQIPPRKFANAADELSMGFRELLSFLSRLYSGGQNEKMWRLEMIRRAAAAEGEKS